MNRYKEALNDMCNNCCVDNDGERCGCWEMTTLDELIRNHENILNDIHDYKNELNNFRFLEEQLYEMFGTRNKRKLSKKLKNLNKLIKDRGGDKHETNLFI